MNEELKYYFIFFIVVIILLIIFINLFIKKYLKVKHKVQRVVNDANESKVLIYPDNLRNLPNDIPYYRDIPCNGVLEKMYLLAIEYKMIPERKLQEGLIGAMILNWLKNGYISITKNKNNNYAIDLSLVPNITDEIDLELLNILTKASGDNYILELNELKKWSEDNYIYLVAFFSKTYMKGISEYENEGIINNKEVSNKFYEDAMNMIGLKKYLIDFDHIDDKDEDDIHLLERYLLFAELLGIADKVHSNFAKLYPNFEHQAFLNETNLLGLNILHIATDLIFNDNDDAIDYYVK